MAKEIKQKIVLDGEKEYSAALKEANRNLKTLKSELKAETAEMGKNASEAEKNRVKRQNLRKQIAEQEKVVKTYRQALQEVREKYADNEDEIAKWEVKLNDARAALGKMKTELAGVGDSFKKTEKGAKEAVTTTKLVATAIGDISRAGDTVADSLEGIFLGMVGIVSDAVSDVWAMITDVAAKANNWTDIASIWNTDPQKIQQYASALQAVGKDFGDLEGNMYKIAFGEHDKIAKLTGVSWAGDIDQWQYALDVLSAIADMDYTRQMNALEEIFGDRRSSKIKNILNDWQTIQELVPQFNGNETGYGLSDEGLETFNDLYIKINEIDAKWDGIKRKVSEGLGVAALGLSVSVEGMLDGVADFLNAKDEGEREAALQKIRTNLEDFFRRLAAVVQECIDILHGVGEELQNSDDPVTKAIGDILVGLTDALKWISENWKGVVIGLHAIFGAWLILKLAAIGGQLLEIVKNIETIKTFKDWKANRDASDGGNGTTTTGDGTGGTGSETGTENVATENVTTMNVTTGNTQTEHVQTMYVQNMVGGNNGGNNGNPSSPTLPGNGGSGGNYVFLPPGSSTPTLPGGDTTLNLPGDTTLNLPGDNTLSLPGGDNTINLDPGDYTVTGPDTPPVQGPEIPPETATAAEATKWGFTGTAFGDWLFYGLGPELLVLAAALTPAAIAQKNDEAQWIEEKEAAEAVADAAEAMGEDVTLLRDLIEATGPKSDGKGGYQYNMFGFLDMNPTDQRDWILQGLGDVQKRGQLHADIMHYGDPENDNVMGWRPWSALLRYWGEYYEEAYNDQGKLYYQHKDLPLDQIEITALLEYLRDIYTKKAEDQMERQKQRNLDNAIDEAIDDALGVGGKNGVADRLSGGLLRLLNADQWQGGGNGSGGVTQDGITRTDLQNFNNLPAQLQRAAQEGTAKGVSGIRVYMDGVAVGHLVAPTVSQDIARAAG